VNPRKEKIDGLMRLIDSLTNSMLEQIANRMFEDLDSLFIQRQQLIDELIELAADDITSEEIHSYLVTFRHRDNSIMRMLQQESEQVKNNLLQLAKVKRYISA